MKRLPVVAAALLLPLALPAQAYAERTRLLIEFFTSLFCKSELSLFHWRSVLKG